jgi:nucleotide-binding universal stress UspA family protein
MSEPQAVIVVALDASAYSNAALEAAVALALDMNAELVGLFVEDVNLLRLAELPFTSEVRTTTAATGPLTGTIMSGALRRQAARARRAFQHAAREAGVHAVFRTVRGQVPSAVLAEAVDADVLVVGRMSHPLSRQRRIGSTARAVVLQAPRSILITKRSPRQPQSVTVALDGSAAGRQALSTGVSLLRGGGRLNIILHAPHEALADLRVEVERWLADRGLVANAFFTLPGPGVDDVVDTAALAPCDLLVVGGDALPTTAGSSQALAERLSCSLLLVR